MLLTYIYIHIDIYIYTYIFRLIYIYGEYIYGEYIHANCFAVHTYGTAQPPASQLTDPSQPFSSKQGLRMTVATNPLNMRIEGINSYSAQEGHQFNL